MTNGLAVTSIMRSLWTQGTLQRLRLGLWRLGCERQRDGSVRDEKRQRVSKEYYAYPSSKE